jgi:hypothetical protein
MQLNRFGALSTKGALALAAVAGAMLAAAPVQAHHSFAMFDRTKKVTVTGTVREFQWTNPHVFIELDVRDPSGASAKYSIEGGSPNMLFRSGWSNTSFKPGDKVTVVMSPLKDGRKGGVFIFATLADGSTLGNLNSGGGPG